MAQKKLKDDLVPASFRGVEFEVYSSSFSAGRRVQVHEYPQRDKPYVEDLGRATREIRFDAFVVGEDYVEQANDLLAALEEDGAGTLVHPWFGTLRVALKEPASVSFDAGLGVARVSLSFVESGELAFPRAAESTQVQSRLAAAALEESAVDSFVKRFNVKGFQDFVTAVAQGDLARVLGFTAAGEIGKSLGYATSLAKTVATAISLIQNPASLGYKIMGAFGLSSLATTYAAWANVVKLLSRTATNYKLTQKSTPNSYTPSRVKACANTNAVNALTRQALIAQAVGVSSLVGTDSDTSAGGYAEMIAVRQTIIAAIDAECLLAESDVYPALMQARAAVWADLTARARDDARLDTLTPPETLPALVVAYDYYEDASRDSEIIARNRIARPGFIAPEPIKVLTR